MKRQDNIEIQELVDYLNYYSEFNNFFAGKSFLITGYKGLIGTGIVKWLLTMNKLFNLNIKLFLSSRDPNSIPVFLKNVSNVFFTEYMNEKRLDVHFDYIIHLAAPTDKNYFVNEPIDTIDSIFNGTKYYLEIALKNNCKFLYASSVEAYGCPIGINSLEENYVGEIDSLNIRSGYPIGKKAAEFLCYSFFKKYNLDVYIVRPSSVQGLYQKKDENRIFNEILRCIKNHEDFIMNSDGMTKKSIIYTLDAVAGFLTILIKGKPGEAYNLTNPDIYYTMNQYVEIVFGYFGHGLKLIHNNCDYSDAYLPMVEYNLSIKKIKSLGWTPRADLKHIYYVDLKN